MRTAAIVVTLIVLAAAAAGVYLGYLAGGLTFLLTTIGVVIALAVLAAVFGKHNEQRKRENEESEALSRMGGGKNKRDA